MRCESKKKYLKQFWFPLWSPKRNAKKHGNKKLLTAKLVNLLTIVILQKYMVACFYVWVELIPDPLTKKWHRPLSVPQSSIFSVICDLVYYLFIEGIRHLCGFMQFICSFEKQVKFIGLLCVQLETNLFSWNWVLAAPNKMFCTCFVQFVLFFKYFLVIGDNNVHLWSTLVLCCWSYLLNHSNI